MTTVAAASRPIADPIAWLEDKVQGFKELPPEDRSAVMHFALLWSLFEDKALKNSANAAAIESNVQKWGGTDTLKHIDISDSLAYFRARYFVVGALTPQFDALRLSPRDRKQAVAAVIEGRENGQAECVAAVLIIIYRLRNNLFHGEKWKYGIRGQLDNFRHANQTLMNILDAIP